MLFQDRQRKKRDFYDTSKIFCYCESIFCYFCYCVYKFTAKRNFSGIKLNNVTISTAMYTCTVVSIALFIQNITSQLQYQVFAKGRSGIPQVKICLLKKNFHLNGVLSKRLQLSVSEARAKKATTPAVRHFWQNFGKACHFESI